MFVAIGERPQRSIRFLTKDSVDDFTDDLTAEDLAIERSFQAFQQSINRIAELIAERVRRHGMWHFA